MNEYLLALHEDPTLWADMSPEDMQRIIALFRITFDDQGVVRSTVRGRPVYLGLAMDRDKKLKMKPQNLLINLPLISGT